MNDTNNDTAGMFYNSYFDNSKSEKSNYVRELEGLVFEKKIFLLQRERERHRQRERETETET